MKNFIVKETVEIIKAYRTETFHVKAESQEEAEQKVIDRFDDDADVDSMEIEDDIRDTEFVRFETEKF